MLTTRLQVTPVIYWLTFRIKIVDDGYDQQESEYSQNNPQPGQIWAATIGWGIVGLNWSWTTLANYQSSRAVAITPAVVIWGAGSAITYVCLWVELLVPASALILTCTSPASAWLTARRSALVICCASGTLAQAIRSRLLTTWRARCDRAVVLVGSSWLHSFVTATISTVWITLAPATQAVVSVRVAERFFWTNCAGYVVPQLWLKPVGWVSQYFI